MHKIKNIVAWLKESKHALHLFGEVILTYIFSALFGIGFALGIVQGQGWKGDYKDDLLADAIGIALGTLAQVLVIVLGGWSAWLSTIIVAAIVMMSGVLSLIPIVKPHNRNVQLAGFIVGIAAFIGLIFC